MADCLQTQNNYVSSPTEMVYGLSNLIYNIKDRFTVKTNELLDIVENTTIDSHSKFMVLNQNALLRHIDMSKQEKTITFELLGNDAHVNGTSDSYSPFIDKPEMMEGMNYLEFAEHLKEKEKSGLATRLDTTPSTNASIRDFNIENLYPQETESAVNNGTWGVGCETNSILYKTQKLFNEKKINTIISRFGTNTENTGSELQYSGQVRTSYGESRGRNLLTKDAESGSGGYSINGYKNPYCRTWTNHYKYDSIYKTMRPFSKLDNSGNYINDAESKKLINVNTWNNFLPQKYNVEYNDKQVDEKKWSWRKNNDGYNKSVMSDGLINFTPEFKGGGSKNRHTRQCMFSIENLAWKDFNPYAFENTLSWEQRGPNGGRIMWFPPYGLTFNETTQAKWQSHQFIGRGEDVYTYQGTVRSGTLSFLLVVDHPSIIDYVFGSHNHKLDNKEIEITDNDIHRYFAGCDADTLTNLAEPTPLTDEYSGIITYGGVLLHDDLTNGKTPRVETPTTSPQKITFHWYFPNNYSGVYDNRELNPSNGVVSAMKYTLMGVAGGIKRNMSVSKKEWTPQPDSILDTSETLGNSDLCTGYCMGKKTPDGLKDEYLIPQQTPRFLSKDKKKNKQMKNVKGKGRFYRVDYDPSFKWPTGEEAYKNTLDQECGGIRKVENGFDYNINAPVKSDNENEQHYSFLLMSCALMEVTGKQPILLNYLKDVYKTELDLENEKGSFKTLVEILTKLKENKLKIKTITSKGYSSVQQSNTDEGKKRNKYLAEQRAETMKLFFKSSGISSTEIEITTDSNASVGENDSNESGQNETQNRRAELIIEFETEQTENSATTEKKPTTEEQNKEQEEQQKIDEHNDIHKYVGYTRTDRIENIGGKEYYLYQEIDNPDNLWYNEDDWIGREQGGNPQPAPAIEEQIKSDDKQKSEEGVASSEYSKNIKKKEDEAIEKKSQLISVRTDVTNLVIECESGKSGETTINVKSFNVKLPLALSIKHIDSAWGEIFTLSTNTIQANGENGATFKIKFTPPPYQEGDKDVETYAASVQLDFNEFEDVTSRSSTFFRVTGKRNASETDKLLIADEKNELQSINQPKLTSWRLYNEDIIKTGKYAGVTLTERKHEKNNLRYDQEYYFFKKLEVADPMVYETLVKKLQYFEPTFHSMTPEGFNGRLTFLQQCMRQGDTLTEIEHIGENSKTTEHITTAQNLAFGRPPFCVLRVGDFFYQTIIIENLSISYDFDGAVKWDLNSEGIGVQPLLAKIQLNIKLLGGSDLSGPIRRLQNAMSFNYYANASLYDNRADRYDYNIDEKSGLKGDLNVSNCFVYDAFTKVENIKQNFQQTKIKEKVQQQRQIDETFGKSIVPDVYETRTRVDYVSDIDGSHEVKSTYQVKVKDGGLSYASGNSTGHKGAYQWDNDTRRPTKKDNTTETPKQEGSNENTPTVDDKK